MSVDELQKWGTFVGAAIAAIASSVSLWQKYSEKSDQIKVGFGPLRPPVAPGYWLYVSSASDHQILLKDYGFINEAGELGSLPQLLSDAEGDDDLGGRVQGGSSSFTKRGELFEMGYVVLRDDQIGAYAITVGQKFYRLDFQRGTPWPKRQWLRFKIFFNPKFQF